jgi:hypothetical protein
MAYETYGLLVGFRYTRDLKPILDREGNRVTVRARSEEEARNKGVKKYRGTGTLIGAEKVG